MQKQSDFEEMGYNKGNFIKMTISLPSILGLSKENIIRKFSYYNSIGISKIILSDTKKIIQSVELSYARYNYFKEQCNLKIDYNNYRKLFAGQKSFFKSTGYTNAEVMQLYPYDEIKSIEKVVGRGGNI